MKRGDKQLYPPRACGGGITLREHFAFETMKAMILNSQNVVGIDSTEKMAERAVKQVDDLITALDKPKGNEA